MAAVSSGDLLIGPERLRPPPALATGRKPSPAKKPAKPKRLTKQDPVHYQSTEAWAWDSLAKFPKLGPVESLHLLPEVSPSVGTLADGEALVQWANFGNAVGTWKARDREGQWACTPGAWLIAMADLSNSNDEDDDEWGSPAVEVAFGCWKVAEGYAVAIMHNRQAATRLPPLLGVAWPTTWETGELWYGP